MYLREENALPEHLASLESLSLHLILDSNKYKHTKKDCSIKRYAEK